MRTEVVKSGNTSNQICFRGLQALAMQGVSCVTKRYRTVPCFLSASAAILKLLIQNVQSETEFSRGELGERIMTRKTDYEIATVNCYKVSYRVVLAGEAHKIPEH
jgi:hypothetical protein